ncbi:hypothetical protein PGTUg99_000233 [Puccinia graminis f. sp. tritici]|uniref:Peptidase S53 domain-containing protein n=2 Tax=Puccinia graminis f. sp. tritici TaxID=56615 RepID=A0A5B0SG20_PUCGR|nr:hypothetical protein PGTUg99_000233 [Puccinia graminis f. sp. tritici]
MKILLLGLTAIISIAGGAKLSLEDASKAALHSSVLFETHRAPARFQKLGQPPLNSHSITLQIGLKNTRFEDSISSLLERMSDPSHPEFRTHLNDEEFNELIQPDDESIGAVQGWLKNHGFQNDQMKWTAHKDWISLERVPLNKVEQMLNTTYHVYRDKGGEHVIRTEKYSLPKYLHRHVDLIQPTTMFGSLHKQRSRVSNISQISNISNKRFLDNLPDICPGPILVTNGCLRQLYKTESYKVKVPERNMIATTGYLGESANLEDAQLFLKTQRADQLGRSFDVILVNGGSNPQELNKKQIEKQLGVEANLDTQTALGLTLPTRNIFYSVGGSPPFIADLGTPQNNNEPFLEWLQYLFEQPFDNIPKVISSSYGDEEQSVPLSYARRVCNGFAALSARGVSLIFSSGDFGVGESGTCYTNDEHVRFNISVATSRPPDIVRL